MPTPATAGCIVSHIARKMGGSPKGKAVTQMDINDLKVVLAVKAMGSYSRAADALGVSHQAISKAMRRIGRSVAKPLFAREGNSLVPTEFCLAFTREALRLTQEFAEFERAFAPARATGAGAGVQRRALSVALVTCVNAGLPQGFFDSFTSSHPDVSLSIEEMSTDQVLAQVKAGAFDLGIVGSHPSLLGGFEMRAVVRMGVWLLVPDGHPLANAHVERGVAHAGVEALDGLPMVTAGASNHLPRYVAQYCARQGVHPDFIAASTDGELVLRLCRERRAACFAFDPRISPTPREGTVVRLDFPGAKEFGTYVIRQPGRQHSETCEAFWREQLPLIGQ